MTTKRDYYDILGVSKKVSKEELKKAYRKKALEFHPDRNKSKDAEEKFKEINEAYEILSNAKKKQAYDQFGHAAFDPASGGFGGFGQGNTQRSGPFTYTHTTGGNPFEGVDFGGFSDPFEIFESFFGGGASPFRRQPARPRYGLTIDFMDAVNGVEKKVKIDGKEHTIKIPTGANDGTRIRFKDFDISIDVKPHQIFQREGSDVFVNHEIPFTLAVLGGETKVPTLDGELKLKIRSGTQPSSMIRLSGKGVSNLHGRGKGHQYIRLIIKIPENLTREQKRLFQELQKTNKS